VAIDIDVSDGLPSSDNNLFGGSARSAKGGRQVQGIKDVETMTIILATFAAMTAFIRELWNLFNEPKYRAILVWLVVILLVGMVFYHLEEGWSWIDALYFSVITLSTVGYGDFSPTTTVSKLFTMVYIFLGISIFVSFASMLAKERVSIRMKRADKAQGESKG